MYRGSTMTEKTRLTLLWALGEALASGNAENRREIEDASTWLTRQKNTISIIWSVKDVQSLDSSLTDKQAMEVLTMFNDNHDGSMIAMWEDLRYHLDEWRGANHA
jgi:hypothetical protein